MAVGFDDPITNGDYPSRNEIEEEEEAAVNTKIAQQYVIKPAINVEALAPGTTLVFLEGFANAILAETVFQSVSVLGTILVPELQRIRSPLEEELGGHHTEHTTLLFQGPGSSVFAALRKPLPSEQAVTWAQEVLHVLKPAAVAKDYRGPGNASDGNLIFAVQSTGTPPIEGVSSLPPGSLITGLAAALLEESENARMPATCVVSVESTPVPDSGLVASAADAICAALGTERPSVAARERIAKALDSAYQSSASNSMFI